MILAPLLGGFLFTSCGDDNAESADTSADTTATASSDDTTGATEDFFYSLPSPMVMAKVFKKTGLKFQEGIANDPKNVTRYTTSYTRSLNLGVYSADLAYTVLNGQTQHAGQYMEAMKRLSDDLGMGSVFDTDGYMTRFKNNLNNEDSLLTIVSLLKSEMDAFMQDNDKEKMTLMIFIGAWVENVYMATQLTREANKEKVAMRIAEQKYLLNSLMTVCAGMHNDSEFSELYKKLDSLKTLFDNLSVQGEEEKLVMDERQLKSITEKTLELRKYIVG